MPKFRAVGKRAFAVRSQMEWRLHAFHTNENAKVRSASSTIAKQRLKRTRTVYNCVRTPFGLELQLSVLQKTQLGVGEIRAPKASTAPNILPVVVVGVVVVVVVPELWGLSMNELCCVCGASVLTVRNDCLPRSARPHGSVRKGRCVSRRRPVRVG